MNDAKARARSGDWGGVGGSTLVGLYAMCHELVYKVIPLELKKTGTFRAASRAASSMLKSHFEGEPDEMVSFIKWAWEREKGRAKWAVENQKDRNRMGWMVQFSESMLTDYLSTRATRS